MEGLDELTLALVRMADAITRFPDQGRGLGQVAAGGPDLDDHAAQAADHVPESMDQLGDFVVAVDRFEAVDAPLADLLGVAAQEQQRLLHVPEDQRDEIHQEDGRQSQDGHVRAQGPPDGVGILGLRYHGPEF